MHIVQIATTLDPARPGYRAEETLYALFNTGRVAYKTIVPDGPWAAICEVPENLFNN